MGKPRLRLKILATQALKRVEKYVRIGAEVTEVLVDLKKNPRLLNLLHVALHSVKAVNANIELYDDDSSWIRIREFDGSYHPLVKDLLTWAGSQGMCKVVTDTFDGKELVVATTDEMIFLLFENDYGKFVLCPVGHDQQQYCEMIGRLCWMRFGTRIRLRREKIPHGRDGGYTTFKLFTDREQTAMGSEVADRLSKRVATFDKHGVGRSMLLYGPPGTGKSNIARFVARGVNGLTLSMDFSDMQNADEDDIIFIVSVLRPDVIVVDDIDRASRDSADMLERIERIKGSIKLLVVTANNLDRIDHALLRPGRFDDVVLVMHLDEEVTRTMVGDLLDEEQFSVVKAWPAAFLNELSLRIRILGATPADAIAELRGRVRNSLKSFGYKPDDGQEE